MIIDNDIKYQPPIQKDDYSMDIEIQEGKQQSSYQNQQEGKHQEPSTSIKAPELKQFGEKMNLDEIENQLFTSEVNESEGKVPTKPLKTFSNSNTPPPQVGAPVIGGKKKHNVRKNNKTKKRTKKLNKTKKKSHKNKKKHNKKKHNKKTKKMKKKRNGNTKSNKRNKKSNPKHKKQLFEMTIKELKERVKNNKSK